MSASSAGTTPRHSSPVIYVSGSVKSAVELLPILQAFMGSSTGCRPRLIGSSGGALIAAFMSLGSVSPGEKRDFLALCETLGRPSLSWQHCLFAVRGWVRAVTGGAACNLRQWRDRCGRGFSVLVYDYSSASPVMLGQDAQVEIAHDRIGVADVLASACIRSTPSFDVPMRPGLPWTDVEAVIPAAMLCFALNPRPLLHFTSSETEGTGLTPCSPQLRSLCDCYEAMFKVEPSLLTWRVHTPQVPDSALAIFHPSRWSQGLISRHGAAAHAGTNSHTIFALGLLVWVLANCLLVLHLLPSDAPASTTDDNARVADDTKKIQHGNCQDGLPSLA